MENNKYIGQYEILEEISHGSISTVYKAYQPNLKRTVLIKKLHQKLVTEEDIRERFLREAQVCAQINHPNIVSVYDFKSDEDGTYLILEYIKGNSLAELMTDSPLPLEVIVTLMGEFLRGLGYAHNKGVIHRDIKPDNLLISEEGVAKVSDFGLAVFEGATTLTRQGMVVGTPAYMSPEQASGKKLNKNSDLFSLGIVLFEMLTGISPYKSDSLSACIKKIISDPSPKLSDYRSDLPIQIEKIVNRLLEKNPAKRYSTCEEVVEDLEQVDLGFKLKPPREIIQEFYRRRDSFKSEKVRVTSTIEKRMVKRRKILSISAALFAMTMVAITVIYFINKDKTIHQEITIQSADAISSSEPALYPNEDSSITAPYASIENIIEEVKSVTANETTSFSQQKSSEKPPIEDASKSIITANVNENANKSTASGIENTPVKIVHTITEPELQKPGLLTITCFPWAEIYLDNNLLGQPPFARPFEVKPGKHTIHFIRPDYPLISKEIYIEPDDDIKIDMNLWEHLGVLKVSTVNTWAEIWVDGRMVDRTPRADPIILTLGEHLIELKNPNYEHYKKTINFEPGNANPVVLSVNLKPKQN